jgi:glycosyltransferase involved in cell wall biosynthesis
LAAKLPKHYEIRPVWSEDDPMTSNQRLRVAIVRDVPSEALSMDVYADGLVAGLRQSYPEWQVIELVPPAYLLKRLLIFKLAKYCYKYILYPLRLRRENADIYHIIDHSYGHLVLDLKKLKKQVVVTCHDLVNFIYPNNLASRAAFPLASMLAWKLATQGLQAADHVLVDSICTANDIIRFLRFEQDSVSVVPLAVDCQFQPLSEREKLSFRNAYSISPNTTCIVHIGTVEQRKNIPTILRVVGFLRDSGVPVHFWKVGESFSDVQASLIKELGIEDIVTYLGRSDKSTLIQIYNAADVLLSPSLYEGFGLTILEAMRCGTPVISSNTSALPEVAGDAAVLVDPLDVHSIAEAIMRIRDDAAYREQLICKGLGRANHFSWASVAGQAAEIYKQVVNNVSVESN